MIKKASILYMLIVLCSVSLYAQQTPHFTQYLYNMQVINPAFLGSRSDFSISLGARSQWMGVNGAPTTRTFSINGRTNNGLSIGSTIINDKIGLATSTNVNIDASYTIALSRYQRLSMGLKGGMTFFNNNLSTAITADNEMYASTSGKYPNVGVGVYWYSAKFFVGFAIPYLLETPIFRVPEYKSNYGISKHLNYFLNAGMRFEVTDKLTIKPSTLIKYTTSLPLSVDINANFLYSDIIETGISYRYNDAVSALFAIIVNKKFRIGYSYDHMLTDFGSKLNTHEIIVHLDLNFKDKGKWLKTNKCYF